MRWLLNPKILNFLMALGLVLFPGANTALAQGTISTPTGPTSFQCNGLEVDSNGAPLAADCAPKTTAEPETSLFQKIVNGVRWFIDVVLHLDHHLNQLAQSLGLWVYLIVFLVIFLETGVVIFPFLPGDSFLFALGALTSVEGAFLRIDILIALTFIAAVTGDALNYFIGKKVGPLIFQQKRIPFLNEKHLEKTQKFYEKYGAKAIVIARFAPIVRTFAPFVAGIGSMAYRRFLTYNIMGGAAWILIFLLAGRFFGNLPSVKSNFHYVIFGIIFVSILPIVVEWWKSRTTS